MACLAAVYLAQLRIAEYRLGEKLIFVFGFTAGILIMLRMAGYFRAAIGRTQSPLGFAPLEGQFLGLWYFGVMFYCTFILTEGSARYILPLVPPVLVCFFRQLEVAEVQEYRQRLNAALSSAMLASGTLVISLFWGLALSHADLEFARVYPKAAEDFRRTTGSMESFCAGEWGFRYYLGRAGVPPLPADESRVRGGSFLALPKLALPYDIPVSLGTMMVPVQTFAYKPKTPLRILDRQSAAGFYSSGWGLIPFSFSGRNLEEIQVQQTNFMVERLPWAQITGKSRIRPWPGFLTLQGQSFPAILVKSGTRILYPMKLREPVSLELLYGISPDAYDGGGENEFNFEVRQLEADGSVLAASRLSLHPGVKPEDRNWHPLKLSLKRTAGGILDFGFACGSIECPGTGAFAQAVLRPAEP